ncbi:MAG: hypothetical protein KDK99_11530 [Verrucomicrobiales bacterium]|nr:hypothetical protein [Verrucomicrobiales bacterium]
MEPFHQALLYLADLMTVAFGLAWMIPLAWADQMDSESPLSGPLPTGFLEFIFAVVPLLWIFRLLYKLPSKCRAAWNVWHRESSVRLMFWLWLAALGLSLSLHFGLQSNLP